MNAWGSSWKSSSWTIGSWGGSVAALIPSIWRLFVVAKEPRAFIVPKESRPSNV